MKRFLKSSFSVLLAITIIFSSAVVGLSEVDFSGFFAVEAKAVGCLHYEMTESGKSWYVVKCDIGTSGEVVVPDKVGNFPVVAIGSSAFNDCEEIESVIIGNNVKKIYSGAFSNCINLTSITFPDCLTSIGDNTFHGCSNLRKVEIPGNVTSIGAGAFSFCVSLPEIHIPDSVTKIGHGAFFGCKSITQITVPGSVANIEGDTFNYCTNLKSVELSDGVTSIGSYAFCECENLTSVNIPDSVTSIGLLAFSDCVRLCSITLPDSITHIDNGAFGGCPLESITIPDSVTYIGNSAFGECTKLSSVKIPANVMYIDYAPFVGCSNLESIIVDENNPEYCSVDGVLFNKEKTVIIQYPIGKKDAEYSIPRGVTSIGNGTFYGSKSLSAITIPHGVTNIEGNAFGACINISEIEIPESVTSIGRSAFCDCIGLTAITISDNVRTIGYRAFYNTYYYNAGSKTENPLYLGNHIIHANDSLSGDYTIREGTKTIAEYAFIWCDKLTSITVPESVTNINIKAFYGCTKLKYTFYKGSESDWNSIKIDEENECLTLTKVHYDCATHKYGEWVTDTVATCTSGGSMHQTCVGCNETITKTFSALGHDYSEEWIIDEEATCTKSGIKSRHCSRCDSKIDVIMVDIKSHNYCESVITREASCTKTGERSKKCSECGVVVREIIPATGHSYSEQWTVDVQPTCTANGTKSRHCLICDAKKDVTVMPVDSTNHLYSNWEIEKNATCDVSGKRVKICVDCGVMVYDIIPATGHSYGGWRVEKAASCTEDGSKYKECVVCGNKCIETLWATGHVYGNWQNGKTATCTEEGYKYKDCINCSERIISTIPTTGHTPTDWIIDDNATVNNVGLKHKECTECGISLESTLIPQLKPATPKLSKVQNTVSGAKVTWGAVEGADSYIVYRKTYDAKTKKWGSWKNIESCALTMSYVDKSAKSGTYYRYTVKAVNEAGNSGYNTSGIKTYFLATPTVSATNSNSGVTVKWSKSAGATGYIVYRKTGTTGWTKIATVKGAGTLSYIDKKASSGVTYRYTVKAYYGSYTSSFVTNGFAVRRLTTPTLKSVTSGKLGVTFKWNKVTGATGYIVYRKTGNGNWQKIATVKGNTKVSYLDKNAKKGVTYKYTLKAYYGTSTSYYNTKGLTIKDKY